MSGIVGYLKHQKINHEDIDLFTRMSKSISNRGEYEKIFTADYILLAKRQKNKCGTELNIINNNNPLEIVFSGKLFNKKSLLLELASCDASPINENDEEIVLQAYLKWGKDCISKFNGYFSLAIWDKRERKLFCARDRMGAQPLFFYRYSNGIIFASEIKALMASGIIKGEIDNYGVKQLLLLGPSRTGGCGIIKGIDELKPGQYLEVDADNFKVATYWKPTALMHTDDYKTTVEKTRELITNAIARQIDSDEPGCFLSGGLDSSIITKVVADIYKKGNKQLKTFSVDYKENDVYFEKNSFQSSRDNYYIDIMSKLTNSDHKYFMLDTQELLEAIDESSTARDLPGMGDIDSSLRVFCKKVGLETDICMSGECADEFFGGYPWYHREELLYRDNFPWLNALSLRESLFNKDILGKNNDEYVYEEYKKVIDYTDCLDVDDKQNKRIREMFMLNYYYFMQTLIDRGDRMSSGTNLEIRMPFCDNAIIDYAFNMPWEYKAITGREKGIMREAFKDLLPEEINNRKKTPYPKTFNPAFRAGIVTRAEKLINDKNSIISELVNKDTFFDLKNNKIAVTEPWYGQLMRLPQIFGYIVELDIFFKRFNLKIT